jgi:hypothetical protein
VFGPRAVRGTGRKGVMARKRKNGTAKVKHVVEVIQLVGKRNPEPKYVAVKVTASKTEAERWVAGYEALGQLARKTEVAVAA